MRKQKNKNLKIKSKKLNIQKLNPLNKFNKEKII